MIKHEALGKFLEENTKVIRTFIELRPLFSKLVEELAYILEKKGIIRSDRKGIYWNHDCYVQIEREIKQIWIISRLVEG